MARAHFLRKLLVTIPGVMALQGVFGERHKEQHFPENPNESEERLETETETETSDLAIVTGSVSLVQCFSVAASFVQTLFPSHQHCFSAVLYLQGLFDQDIFVRVLYLTQCLRPHQSLDARY